MMPKGSPEALSANRVIESPSPIYAGCDRACCFNILHERTRLSKKPDIHLEFGAIQSSGQRSHDPCGAGFFNLRRTKQMENRPRHQLRTILIDLRSLKIRERILSSPRSRRMGFHPNRSISPNSNNESQSNTVTLRNRPLSVFREFKPFVCRKPQVKVPLHTGCGSCVVVPIRICEGPDRQTNDSLQIGLTSSNLILQFIFLQLRRYLDGFGCERRIRFLSLTSAESVRQSGKAATCNQADNSIGCLSPRSSSERRPSQGNHTFPGEEMHAHAIPRSHRRRLSARVLKVGPEHLLSSPASQQLESRCIRAF